MVALRDALNEDSERELEKFEAPGKCKFELAWVGKCNKPTVRGSEMCEKHAGIECCSCGQPATRECDETLGPFVCGFPLCDKCEHEIAPDGTNGGMAYCSKDHHCRNDEQEHEPWFVTEWKKDVLFRKF